MTITLTPEIERALKAWADKQGATPEILALHELSKICVETVTPDPFEGKTLADVLAGMTGIVRSSENTGIKPSKLSTDKTSFTDHLVEKRKQGRL